MSLQSRITKLLFRTGTIGWTDGTIPQQRIQQERVTGFAKLPVDTRCRAVDVESMESEWIGGDGSG